MPSESNYKYRPVAHPVEPKEQESNMSSKANQSVYPNLDEDKQRSSQTQPQSKQSSKSDKNSKHDDQDQALQAVAPSAAESKKIVQQLSNDDIPHAKMKSGQFDLSDYVQSGLVDSLSRLTSIQWAVMTVLKPAARIMWKSLFLQDKKASVATLFQALISNKPIKDINLSEAKKQVVQVKSDQNLPTRIVRFVFLGIPLAILVGLLYGLVNFIQGIFLNALAVARISNQLYKNASEDVKYYHQHPDKLPERRVAIDASLNQVVAPYISRILSKKLWIGGPFIARKVQPIIGRIASKRINAVYDHAENIGKKFHRKHVE